MIAAVLMVTEVPGEVQRSAWSMVQEVATFLVALTVIAAFVWKVAIQPALRKHREWVEHIAASQRQTAERLERVDHQLHPNGGSSAHDYARRAAEGVEEVRSMTMHNARRLDHLASEVVAQGFRHVQHETAGREYLALARSALAQQGIDLPPPPTESDEVKL